MATNLTHCKEIVAACRLQPDQINAVCHVLRYLSPCMKLKELIDSGVVGDIVSINHTEPVGYEHFAHSFVRGNWANEAESSFSLLAKCCHDIDLLIYWMGRNVKCQQVSSFGSLFHFKRENAPLNSAERCFECPCESECCYSAKKIYFKTFTNPNGWPISIVLEAEIHNVLNDVNDIEELAKSVAEKNQLLEKCLRNEKTKYGRCVYKTNNDVCDNQTVSLRFDNNATATLTMIAFSKDLCSRKTIIYGTKGQLEWDDAKAPNQIQLYEFVSKRLTLVDCALSRPVNNQKIATLGGHGGSDYWLMDSFVQAVLKKDKSLILTDVEDSLRSHLVVFAAEHSRLTNQIVKIEDFCKINNIQLN